MAEKTVTIRGDYSLDEKLKIIEILSEAAKISSPIFYDFTKDAEQKLKLLIDSI